MKDDKRLKRKVRNSYIVSTVSMALVLFLLGSVGYLLTAALKTARTLQESVAVSIELDREHDEAVKAAIGERLAAEPLVAEFTYSPKEEKLADNDFRKMFESEFEELLEENPLRDSYELRLAAAAGEAGALDALVGRLEGLDGVERVSYPAMVAERLHATVARIRLVLLLFGGALLVISLILVGNTIRLAIFAKRYLINTMKLVGATKWFIMRPFLGDSIRQGIGAGAGASALFWIAVEGLNETLPELTNVADAARIAAIAGAMICGGVVLSLLFTFAAVNKFVNMKSNKIHLY